MTGVASDEARAATASRPSPAVLGQAGIANAWFPIATAPKDGTAIILGSSGQEYQGKPVEPRSTVGHWLTEEECREPIGDCGGECRCPEYKYHDPYWMSYDGGFTEENPATHWQPLPAPPLRASVPSADEPRQLAEALARYLDPDAFNGRRRSKRNSDAAYRARKHAMKQAKAAIRFMVKPGNIDRLLVTQAAKAATSEENPQ